MNTMMMATALQRGEQTSDNGEVQIRLHRTLEDEVSLRQQEESWQRAHRLHHCGRKTLYTFDRRSLMLQCRWMRQSHIAVVVAMGCISWQPLKPRLSPEVSSGAGGQKNWSNCSYWSSSSSLVTNDGAGNFRLDPATERVDVGRQ